MLSVEKSRTQHIVAPLVMERAYSNLEQAAKMKLQLSNLSQTFRKKDDRVKGFSCFTPVHMAVHTCVYECTQAQGAQ